MRPPQICWILYLLLAISYFANAAETTDLSGDRKADDLELYQTCHVFMAPSTSGMGWGAFAGRDFGKGEIVEMAPGIIPLEEDSRAYLYSALFDYTYGYFRLDLTGTRPSIHYMQAVMLGFGMIYNHHPVSPNLEFTTFGREPAPDVPNTANSIGFIAVRDIAAGEELFSVYGQEDGGKDWFARRKIPMKSPGKGPQLLSPSNVKEAKAQYCSKIFAGIGRNTWTQRILPILPPNIPFFIDPAYIPPFPDAEIGSAIAKISVKVGERIEWGTGMMMSQKQHLQGTPLAPVAWTWQSLAPDHQQALQTLHKRGKLRVQANQWNSAYTWDRENGFQGWEDVAILPIGGSLGLVHRSATSKFSNCRLRIPLDADFEAEDDSVVVALELIATKDIPVGETLHLDLIPSDMPREEAMLTKELQLMGRAPTTSPNANDAAGGEL